MKKVISAILGLGVNIIIYVVAIFILFRAGAFAYEFSYEVFGEPVVSEYNLSLIHISEPTRP